MPFGKVTLAGWLVTNAICKAIKPHLVHSITIYHNAQQQENGKCYQLLGLTENVDFADVIKGAFHMHT